ncbi:hypothetical protein ACQKWADRAFT_285404, partial [Trichoderma austrokoningii]
MFAHNTPTRTRGLRFNSASVRPRYEHLDANWVVTLRAGYNTELGHLGAQASWTEASLVLVEAILVDIESGEDLAREISWPEPLTYDGPERDDEPEPLWENNMVDLLPGQEISCRVKDLKGRKASRKSLYDWEI